MLSRATSTIQPTFRRKRYDPVICRRVETQTELLTPRKTSGVAVSLFTGGAFFGAGFAGPVGDYVGRKWTIFIGGLIFIIGACFQTAAQTIEWLYGGRAIAGLGVGFLVMIIPIYQGEIAHPSIRGRVTALQQFMLGIGSFVAGWLSYGTYSINNTGAFRSKSKRGLMEGPTDVYSRVPCC